MFVAVLIAFVIILFICDVYIATEERKDEERWLRKLEEERRIAEDIDEKDYTSIL